MNISRKNPKQRSRNLKKVAKRLAAYSAAAAATVMTTGDRTANAAEVVHDILDISIDATTIDPCAVNEPSSELAPYEVV